MKCRFDRVVAVLGSIFPPLLFALSIEAAQTPVVRIGVVIDGPWERNQEVFGLFQAEIQALAGVEFDVRFPDEKTIVGNWTPAGSSEALDSLLVDREVDLVMAMGVMASDSACRRGDLPKPVVAPFVIDAEVQGLPQVDGASGVRNLNYLSSTITLRRDLEVFREILPFRHLAVLSTFGLRNMVPELRQAVQQVADELEIELHVVDVKETVESALAVLPADTEAVYVFPLLQLLPGELDRLSAGLIERGLPSFSRFGRTEVERGILAGLSEQYFPRRARRVALNVQRILLGEDPSTFSVSFLEREELTINMTTARAINVYPSFALMTVAELIKEDRKDVDRSLTLRSAMEQAIAANLDLAARDRAVAAGAEEIPIAKSFLLPELDFSAAAVLIDKDRAALGIQPERLFSPALTLTQVIYSEPAHANLQIQKDLQEARELDRETLRLDIVQDAATAYLNVLRAKTVEQIRRNNLELTRSNLELARVRESIGFSGPAEVFRWESQIAADRSAVIDAVAFRNVAEIAVNRLLNRPLEEPFLTEEIGLEDPSLDYIEAELRPYFSNLWYFDIFRDFMAQLGFELAPELRTFDAAIAAQERSLTASKRAFYVPDILFQGEVERPFRGGAGSSGLGVFEGLTGFFPDVSISQPNDVNWALAIDISLPLFTSGRRMAVKHQDIELLSRLRLDRESTAQTIEQRIRSALHAAGASYAGIRLAEDAAEAAGKNLALVTDAYSRGTVPILDLLDAQNASLSAEEAAANAVYDFLIDFLEVERSVGRFYLLASPEGRQRYFERADAFYRERGATPPRRNRR
jgi:outer membrane protein TolC